MILLGRLCIRVFVAWFLNVLSCTCRVSVLKNSSGGVSDVAISQYIHSPCICLAVHHRDCNPPPELLPAPMLSQRHCCLEGTSRGAWLLGLGVWSRSLQTWVCTDAQDS